MNTREKGEYACIKIQEEALLRGYIISRPTMEGSRYDMILDDGEKLQKVQVKYANAEGDGVTYATLSKKSGGKAYTAKEVDLLMVFIPKLNKICAFGPEVFAGRTKLFIRYGPPRNGQKKGCVNATDYFW